MGYWFVGIRRGEPWDGDLTGESLAQLGKTAEFLRGFKASHPLPKVVYSDGSPEGNTTAKVLADLLEIRQVEVSSAFNGESGFRTTSRFFGLIRAHIPLTPMERMHRELTRLERSVSHINIAVCPSNLLRAYLMGAYQKFGKEDLATEARITLKPGECVIAEQHDDWGFQLKKIYPSKRREDVLADW